MAKKQRTTYDYDSDSQVPITRHYVITRWGTCHAVDRTAAQQERVQREGLRDGDREISYDEYRRLTSEAAAKRGRSWNILLSPEDGALAEREAKRLGYKRPQDYVRAIVHQALRTITKRVE